MTNAHSFSTGKMMATLRWLQKEHMPVERQLSFRLRAMFTSTLSPWIRKVHSRVASKPSLIESTWKRQRWAGSPVPR